MKKGYVDINDLRKLKEINQNPLQNNILSYLCQRTKHEGEINFELYVLMLDTFQHKNYEAHKKCNFSLCYLIFNNN